MKTLLILRHGKAEDHSPQGDKGRALTERGKHDAATVAAKILETFGCPDLILASDAMRARQTAQTVAAAVGYPGEITLESAVYEAEVGDLLGVIAALPDRAESVLLVGHNPGLEQLAGLLDGEAVARIPLPTAGMVPLQFDVPGWKDVLPRTGRRVPMTLRQHQEKRT